MSLVGKTVVLVMVALWMNERVGLDLMVDLKRNETMQNSFVTNIEQFGQSNGKFYLVVASTKDVADLAVRY